MRGLLDSIYYSLRKEEIEKASTRFKKIKTDTILQNLTKLCWKYNIAYEIIMKTSDVLIIKLTGMREIVVIKYHKTYMVMKDEVDYFVDELGEIKARKGIYITTGEFEINKKKFLKELSYGGNLILEDNFTFIKANLGFRGKAVRKFKPNNLNFLKYLPK